MNGALTDNPLFQERKGKEGCSRGAACGWEDRASRCREKQHQASKEEPEHASEVAADC